MCELCACVRELREVASRKEQCIFKPSLSVVRGLRQQVQLAKPASLLIGQSFLSPVFGFVYKRLGPTSPQKPSSMFFWYPVTRCGVMEPPPPPL